MAWDALYEAQPTDSTYVADTDDAIRSMKTEIRTRVANEHGFNLSESAPQSGHGKHLRGSARIFVQSTDPTATSVTADDADYATGRVWLDSDDGRLKVYRGGTWNSGIAVSYADNAGNSYACSGNAATATNATNSVNATNSTNAIYASYANSLRYYGYPNTAPAGSYMDYYSVGHSITPVNLDSPAQVPAFHVYLRIDPL